MANRMAQNKLLQPCIGSLADELSPKEAEDRALIVESGLFDVSWYLTEYKDVARSGSDAITHYIKHGADEGRLPFRTFNPVKYLGTVRSTERLRRNALAEYISAINEARLCPHVVPEADAKALFFLRARLLQPNFGRRRIDFNMRGSPEISVIVVMRNQIHLTLSALASLRDNYPGSIDMVLVDSGSTDSSHYIERYVSGARIIRFDYNAGYIRACNSAIPLVKSPITVFMNNDVLLESGAVATALQRFTTTPHTGAVGGKIVRTNGMLQEAGCIIWRDGTTEGYLRDGDPNCPEANFVREVDFCSGVFLAVNTKLLQSLGGFDTLFEPAYFEDTDLCIRIAIAGYKVIYDPGIVVIHVEHGSSDPLAASATMTRSQPIFKKKHAGYLSSRLPRHSSLSVHARSSDLAHQRILFIEDRLPLRTLGSGYTRSNDIINVMAGLGYNVTVFPIETRNDSLLDIYRDFSDTVEIIHDRDLAELEQFIKDRTGFFNIIWVARTHNAARIAKFVIDAKQHLPTEQIVVDTEALAALRGGQRALLDKAPAEAASVSPGSVKEEMMSIQFCHTIVAVNAMEAEAIRGAGYDNVAVLGHKATIRATNAAFEKRRDLLFVGAIHDQDSPNLDSLTWFAANVLPLLDAAMPGEVRLTIAGYADPRIDFSKLGRNRHINLLGQLDDLEPLYNSHRLFIAPTRYSAGIPFKLHEAASFGLPIVASSLLCRQVGWLDGVDLLAGDTANPASFAKQILRAYKDVTLWYQLRDAALARLEAENGPINYQLSVNTILNGLNAVI